MIYFLQSVTYKIFNYYFLCFFIAHTSNGLNKRRYIPINEIIEEEDEDKNNNTNNVKNNKAFAGDGEKENNKNNIKIVKDEKCITNKNKKNNKINLIYHSLSSNQNDNNENSKKKILSEKHNQTNENDLIKNISNINNNFASMREKFLFENKNKIIINDKIELPLLKKNNNNSPNISNIFNKNQVLHYNNISNESPSTTAFSNSNKNILKSRNLTDQISKYRLGLLSANSSLNNNNNNKSPMIPIIPINRPVSNFNFGGNQLWELDNINTSKTSSKNVIKSNNNIVFNPILNDKHIISKTTKNKNTVKSLDMKGKSHSIEKININSINNLKTAKFHKIKIDKSLANNNIFANIMNKQLNDFKSNFNNDFFHMKSGNKSHSVKK